MSILGDLGPPYNLRFPSKPPTQGYHRKKTAPFHHSFSAISQAWPAHLSRVKRMHAQIERAQWGQLQFQQHSNKTYSLESSVEQCQKLCLSSWRAFCAPSVDALVGRLLLCPFLLVLRNKPPDGLLGDPGVAIKARPVPSSRQSSTNMPCPMPATVDRLQ